MKMPGKPCGENQLTFSPCLQHLPLFFPDPIVMFASAHLTATPPISNIADR
jgi:hypothetical protein